MQKIRTYVAIVTDGDLDVVEFDNEKERLGFLAGEDAMTSDYFNLDVDAEGLITTDSALTGDDAEELLDDMKD